MAVNGRGPQGRAFGVDRTGETKVMSETAENPKVTGNMFLFQQPELVSREQHGSLGVSAVEKRYDFCSKVRAIPITVSEIPAAIKDYPVIFASLENMLPLAVVGLVDDENLFVDDKGQWEAFRYIPGYIRRYPFGVATETGGDRFAVVVDRAFEGLKDGGEQKLFNGEEPSQLTQSAIDFCRTYEEDRMRTVDFGNRVKELNIVKGQSAQFTPVGENDPKTFAEYLGVDEQGLKEIAQDKFIELRDTTLLPLLYAMVISMGNWRAVLQRRGIRHQLAEKDILNRINL